MKYQDFRNISKQSVTIVISLLTSKMKDVGKKTELLSARDNMTP